MPPTPTSETLNLSTDVSEADVVFSIDTTGSMGNAINNLKSSLSTVAGAVQTKVKSVSMGVVGLPATSATRYVVKLRLSQHHRRDRGRPHGRAERAQRAVGDAAAATIPRPAGRRSTPSPAAPALNDQRLD